MNRICTHPGLDANILLRFCFCFCFRFCFCHADSGVGGVGSKIVVVSFLCYLGHPNQRRNTDGTAP